MIKSLKVSAACLALLSLLTAGSDRKAHAQAQAQFPIPVRERIHARRDLFAGLAQEQIEVLHDWRIDAPIAEALEMLAEQPSESPQAAIVGRQRIVHAANALDFESFHPRPDPS